MSAPQPPRLRDYTNVPFEIFIAVFTILPFFLLAYFYSVLPDRVPLFMHLNGEVAEWGRKSVISVFRVPFAGRHHADRVFVDEIRHDTIELRGALRTGF